MFEKTKRQMREMATNFALKVQMFVLTMLCGVTSAMAQNSAGDYSAGTTALATVTEENAFWLNHTQIKYDKMNIKLKKTRYK